MNRIILLLSFLLLPIGLCAQKASDYMESYNFKRGIELMQDENADLNEALGFFQKELSEHPQNGYALYCVGSIYYNNDRTGDALDYCNKALPLLKKDKVWLPSVYRLRAKVYLQLDDEAKALKDWQAALKVNPTDETILAERSEYFYSIGKYAEAEADYDVMMKAEPGKPWPYLGKGRNAMKQGHYDRALELFNYAVKLAPDKSNGYAFRADAFIALHRDAEAADDIIKAIAIDNNRWAFSQARNVKSPLRETLLAKLRIQQTKEKNESKWSFFQGLIYKYNKDYDQAIKAFEAANDISVSASAYANLYDCHYELGQYVRALNDIDKALAIDSTETSCYLDKANALYESGQAPEAIALLGTYIDMEPENFYGYYRRGFFKYTTGDIDGAIDDFTSAIVLEPNYAYSLVERGECYQIKGNADAARADFVKVIELSAVADSVSFDSEGNPDTINIDDRNNLNLINYDDPCCVQYAYLGLGRNDLALAVVDSILAHNQNAGSYYDAACLYSRMGLYDKAAASLRQALERGYRRFYHMSIDRDIDNIRNRQDVKDMFKQYEAQTTSNIAPATMNTLSPETNIPAATVKTAFEIPFTREAGGLCAVKCNINGLPLKFWLDTGASSVSISMLEATFMLKNGYLNKDDVVGSSYFLDAGGNVNEGTVLNLKKVSLGPAVINNVRASVVKNQKAPLLLGQSVLGRLGSVEIDNQKRVIRIKPI